MAPENQRITCTALILLRHDGLDRQGKIRCSRVGKGVPYSVQADPPEPTPYVSKVSYIWGVLCLCIQS
jgi:hypothetical protein